MRLSQKFFLRGRLQHIPSYRWLSYTTYSKNNVALLTFHYSLFTFHLPRVCRQTAVDGFYGELYHFAQILFLEGFISAIYRGIKTPDV